MRILACDVRDYEKADFHRYAEQFDLDVTYTAEPLTAENTAIAQGCDGISFLGQSVLDRKAIAALHDLGVHHLSSRIIGFNNIDLDAAREYGMNVSNARYMPNNVADFAVMLMLMLMRHAKISVCRALVNDFSLDHLEGREMHSMTVGIIGTGRIGALVAQNLSGFGCRILAYDKYENDRLRGLLTYTDLDTLLRESDIITLHTPLTDENFHLIDREALTKMKDGVLLVNTARGPLIDTTALLDALESGKVGGAGLDSVEGEEGVMHVDVGANILNKRDLLYLKQFPNVIYTQHYGFFTEEAAAEMVRCSMQSLYHFYRQEENPYQII